MENSLSGSSSGLAVVTAGDANSSYLANQAGTPG